eukprot:9070333-Pyramimonas_sp.AAC.1
MPRASTLGPCHGTGRSSTKAHFAEGHGGPEVWLKLSAPLVAMPLQSAGGAAKSRRDKRMKVRGATKCRGTTTVPRASTLGLDQSTVPFPAKAHFVGGAARSRRNW